MNTEQKDDLLWQMAKKRAGFKWQLVSYVLVNTMLVAIWFLSSYNHDHFRYFWPIWPMLGWGIGLAFSYFAAYHGNNLFTAEKEYEKLKNNQ
jgi:hypothetical protein